MTKLRILICAFACDPKASSGLGSGEDLLGWNIIKEINRFCGVWIITSLKNKSGIETYLKQNPLYNLHFHYVDFPSWLRWPFQWLWSHGGSQFYFYIWQIKAYFVAQKLHRKFRFDAFHHITYANDWMASFIGALLPVPYIRGPGGGAHRVPKNFLSEFSFSGRLSQSLRSIGQWLFRHDPFFIIGQRRARAILVCNQEALEAIPKKWRGKTHLFPVNGISTNDLNLLTSREISTNKFSVFTAGKLIQIKGFGLAIKAFKIFTDKFLETEFTIIGDGPELARLKSLVSQLGLEKKVHFLGWMAREELLKRMLSADVFLFPSLRDGGGAVVVEAMAAGKPTICLDIGGPGLHITDECGIKVTPHSSEQAVGKMAVALERLYSDKELRLRMGKEARARAEQVYHWDQLGERLLKIYQEALGFQPSKDDMESEYGTNH
jgi:glycosyltransferase involved in cell wall biosynthesis